MEPKLRNATFSDCEFLLACCRDHIQLESADVKMNQEWETEFAKSVKGNSNDSDSGPFFYVIDAEGRQAGYLLVLVQYSTFDACRYLYLDCLFLVQAFRGKGIGLWAMNELRGLAAQLDCPFLEWQTPASNGPAIRFYEKLTTTGKPKVRFRWTLN